jgi:RND family efflux transporter MFP subunit
MLAGAALVVSVLLVGWIWLQAGQARQMSDPAAARLNGQPIPVRTALVQETNFDEGSGATAVTIPSMTVNVRIGPSRGLSTNAPVSEVLVKEIHVQEGSPVSENQLLVTLEDEGLRQICQQREAALASAKAELDRVLEQTPLNQRIRELDKIAADAQIKFRTEDLENRRQYYESSNKLFRERAVTLLEYWDSRSRFAQAQHGMTEAEYNRQRIENAVKVGELTDQKELTRARNAYEVSRIDLDLARRDLERSQVRSPIAGMVGKLNLVPGSVVGVTELIAEVVKLDPLHLRLDYPQERLDEVAVGQAAEVTLDNFRREALHGKVIRILPRVNPNLRVLPVIVEVNNPNNRIKAGISGYVRLRATRQGLTVPALAVQQRGNKAVVFRVEDGHARIREVTVGSVLSSGDQEVRGGLNAGDEVVINQSNFYKNYGQVAASAGFLQDNDLVDADWRRWARRDE